MPKLIEFRTTDNLILPGLLYKSKKNIDSSVAIFLHGCGDSSVFYSTERGNILAKELGEQGVDFFNFNNRGAHAIKRLKKVINQEGETEDVWQGTGFELIKDCVHDIDGAIEYLEQKGYKKLYLIGHSTGANKIAVYNKYKPNNKVKKYILLGAGDDFGIYYSSYKEDKFWSLRDKAKKKIKEGKGLNLVPKYFVPKWAENYVYSYQSFDDITDPDGDYNCFPFLEYSRELQISKKPLFAEYKMIKKSTLVIYGEYDYFQTTAEENIQILKKISKGASNFEYEMIAETGHGFQDKYDELGKTITTWIKK